MSSEADELDQGEVDGDRHDAPPGVVVLSASFDDGLDGDRRRPRPAAPKMVAPALVATDVPAGTHTIAFEYNGYGGYFELFALSALTLAVFAGAHAHRRKPVRRR